MMSPPAIVTCRGRVGVASLMASSSQTAPSGPGRTGPGRRVGDRPRAARLSR